MTSNVDSSSEEFFRRVSEISDISHQVGLCLCDVVTARLHPLDGYGSSVEVIRPLLLKCLKLEAEVHGTFFDQV